MEVVEQVQRVVGVAGVAGMWVGVGAGAEGGAGSLMEVRVVQPVESNRRG